MSHTRAVVSAAVAATTAVLTLAGCNADDQHATPGAVASTGASTAPVDAAVSATQSGTLEVEGSWHLPPGSGLLATPDWLWVLGGPSGVLTQIDPGTNTIVRTVTPPHPPGFGTYAHGSLWIASLLDDAVMRLDAESGRVLRTIESSRGGPFNRPIGVASVGRDLWVVNHGDDTRRSTLTRLDERTGTVTGHIALPGHHAGGPLVADGQLWIPMTSEGTVVRVDPSTGRVVGAPLVVDTGTCLSASLADGALWYTGLDDEEGGTCRNAARRVDADTAQLSPLTYGAGRSLFDFAAVGGSVWASDIGRTVYRVDVDAGTVTPGLTLHGPAAGNRMIAAFESLWVLGGETGRLVRISVN